MFKRRAKRMHTVFRFSVTTMKLANSTTSTIVHVQTLLLPLVLVNLCGATELTTKYYVQRVCMQWIH